jgi:hypothetical protein
MTFFSSRSAWQANFFSVLTGILVDFGLLAGTTCAVALYNKPLEPARSQARK